MRCPKCKTIEMKVYNGSLGYESLKCPKCDLDVKSDDALYHFNIYTSELRAEIAELKREHELSKKKLRMVSDVGKAQVKQIWDLRKELNKAKATITQRNHQISDLRGQVKSSREQIERLGRAKDIEV